MCASLMLLNLQFAGSKWWFNDVQWWFQMVVCCPMGPLIGDVAREAECSGILRRFYVLFCMSCVILNMSVSIMRVVIM